MLKKTPGPHTVNAKAAGALDRGRYLTQALGHCGECHTPRNILGGPSSRHVFGRRDTGKGIVVTSGGIASASLSTQRKSGPGAFNPLMPVVRTRRISHGELKTTHDDLASRLSARH